MDWVIVSSVNGLLSVCVTSQYLNQWWLIVNWTPRNKIQGNLKLSTNFFEGCTFENVISIMLAILYKSQCVEKPYTGMSEFMWCIYPYSSGLLHWEYVCWYPYAQTRGPFYCWVPLLKGWRMVARALWRSEARRVVPWSETLHEP